MTLIRLPGGWVDIRPITGHDENAVTGTDLGNLLVLIDRLLVQRPGALVGPGSAVRLTSATRDRLLAEVYREIYGETITSSPRCTGCGERFDLTFNLPDLLAAFPTKPVPSDGRYRAEQGLIFRLPTGEDELAVAGLSVDAACRELVRRCVLAPSDPPLETVEAAMEAVAPPLNVDLAATCPDCGRSQQIRFDMGTYLLARLLNDQAQLASDIHVLALSYHWSLHEIAGLTRSERRRFLTLIEADARRARSRIAAPSTRRRKLV